jgi:chromosomal replication initiator protein
MAYGGKGVANVYFPAFERTKLAATFRGTKLAARCDLYWEQRSQSGASKDAAHCEPTLDLKKDNPVAAFSEPSDMNARHWRIAKANLSSELGEAAAAAWFDPVTVESVGDRVILGAPSKFHKDWIETHYAQQLRSSWQVADASIQEVRLVVRKGRPQTPPDTIPADRNAVALDWKQSRDNFRAARATLKAALDDDTAERNDTSPSAEIQSIDDWLRQA